MMMKNLLYLLAIVVLFSACEETQDAIANPSSVVPGVNAKIDGTAWKADVFAGVLVDTVNALTITATKNSDNSFISIVIPDPEVKTYTVGDTTSNVVATYKGTNVRYGASGEVAITSYSNTLVTGTFNITTDTLLGDPIEITEGVITNVPVTVQ
jgi:hypothetical protein